MLTIEKTYVCGARLSAAAARRYGTRTNSRASVYLLRSKGFGAHPAIIYKAVLYDKYFNMIASTAWSETIADRVLLLFEAIGPGSQRVTGDASLLDWQRLV